MKKLFALISLLGLVAGMGGTLNAQEEAGDTQSKLDTIFLYHYFQNPGKAQTLKFKFAATPGEKFIIFWKGSIFSDATDTDTISIETEKEIEVAYTFTSGYTLSRPQSNVALFALTPTGHIKSLRIDSTYKYSELTCKNCMLLDTIQVPHNTLESLIIWNCPTLKFLDISHNKVKTLYFGEVSSVTYLDCSHNDIKDIGQHGFTSLETLDCSYNRCLRQVDFSDYEALTNLTVRCNDSLDILNLSNLPLQHLTCTENQKLSRINANNCRFQTLDVSGNPALEMLECNYNQLTALTAQNCPALTSISCSRNQLSYLDLNYCKSLRNLYCDNNRLSSLDIRELEQLEILDVSNNKLSSIEIPENVKLRGSCTHNHIPIATLVELTKRIPGINNVSPQFLTAGFIQVGNVLDMREDCQRDYGNLYTTQCAVLQNEEQADEQSCTMGQEYKPDYGLMTFHKAGTYRIRLSTYGITYAADTFYYDLTVVDSVVRPQFSIPSGTVLPDTALVLSTPTPDARIYYTTDGSEPDETALAYAAPIRITEAITIKAIAIQDTFQSHIAIATYTMDSVARPTFSIPSGKVKRGTTVNLSTTTPDARIIYTTNGTEPDNNALEYTTPISITETMTIKAIAIYKTVQSQVAMATYTMDTVTDTIIIANEHDLKASYLRVYTKDRTIYLSETVGEVEVFTMDGHCVYRGYDTAIPVGKSGMYIVSAAGRRGKVAVR